MPHAQGVCLFGTQHQHFFDELHRALAVVLYSEFVRQQKALVDGFIVLARLKQHIAEQSTQQPGASQIAQAVIQKMDSLVDVATIALSFGLVHQPSHRAVFGSGVGGEKGG